MLLVYGSIDSLLPRICAVDAVGMGASSRLFRSPHLLARRNGRAVTLPTVQCRRAKSQLAACSTISRPLNNRQGEQTAPNDNRATQ